MDSDNSQHSQPAQPAQDRSADDSLYAQITAEDVIQAPVVKKQPSPFTLAIAKFMELTLYLDSVKRTHQPLFHTLSNLWACFMSIIYAGGALTLFFAVYSMMQLPLFIEDQLRQRNLSFDNLHLADYSLTRIEVQNLKDSNNMYEVDSLIVHSTFADFLQKRIRSVTIDGVRINLAQKDDQFILDQLPLVLNEVQNPTRGKLGLEIDAITVNNATINFQQGTTSIPVTFSMNGIYGNKTDILITLMIKQPNLSANGTLTINGQNTATTWKLDILNGKLALPKRSPEDLTGSINFKMSKDRIDGIDFDLKLSFGTLGKSLQGNLVRSSDTAMSASLIWAEENLTEPDLSSQVRFTFDELILGNKTVESHKSIQIYATSFVNSLMKLTDLNTLLVGDLVCKNWSECDFQLTAPATITIQDSAFSYQGRTINGTKENSFILQPSERTLFLSLYDPYLKLNWNMSNVNFSGFWEVEDDPLIFHADVVKLVGYFSDSQKSDNMLSVQTNGTEYVTNKLKFIDGDITISDVLNPTRQVRVLAREIHTPTLPLLTFPFDMDLTMLGSQSLIKIQPTESSVIITLDGKFYPTTPAFVGKIKIPEFSIENLKLPINEISPILSNNISNITGRLAIDGQIVWQGQNAISGPLKIAAKGVSFDWNKTRIEGVNTVLSVSSVLPFTTESNQRLFINEIHSMLPFTSTEASFQIDNQALRLIDFDTYLGNVELSVPPSVIPLKNTNMLLFLKNNATANLKTLSEYVNLPQLSSIQGSASISIPVELKNDDISIPYTTIKISNATLKRQNKAWPEVFAGDSDYIMRSGQLIVNKNKMVKVSLDGRIYPSREKKSVELNQVSMPSDLFLRKFRKPIPKIILDAQAPFFKK